MTFRKCLKVFGSTWWLDKLQSAYTCLFRWGAIANKGKHQKVRLSMRASWRPSRPTPRLWSTLPAAIERSASWENGARLETKLLACRLFLFPHCAAKQMRQRPRWKNNCMRQRWKTLFGEKWDRERWQIWSLIKRRSTAVELILAEMERVALGQGARN